MKCFLNKTYSLIIGISLPYYCFGNIIAFKLFTNSEGTPNKGSFFSGCIYPFNFSHSKIQYSENTAAGLILQFKDKNYKQNPQFQKNNWILRMPTSKSEIHELKGSFDFDIDSNNLLTVNLKELTSIRANGKKIVDTSSPLAKVSVFDNLFKKIVKATAFLDVSKGFFDKHIILLNKNKKEDYTNGLEINIQKIKEYLSKNQETYALGYRLPDDPNEYIVGMIEPPMKKTVEPNSKSSNSNKINKYAISQVDFVYLKYNPEVEASHRRY